MPSESSQGDLGITVNTDALPVSIASDPSQLRREDIALLECIAQRPLGGAVPSHSITLSQAKSSEGIEGYAQCQDRTVALYKQIQAAAEQLRDPSVFSWFVVEQIRTMLAARYAALWLHMKNGLSIAADNVGPGSSVKIFDQHDRKQLVLNATILNCTILQTPFEDGHTIPFDNIPPDVLQRVDIDLDTPSPVDATMIVGPVTVEGIPQAVLEVWIAPDRPNAKSMQGYLRMVDKIVQEALPPFFRRQLSIKSS